MSKNDRRVEGLGLPVFVRSVASGGEVARGQRLDRAPVPRLDRLAHPSEVLDPTERLGLVLRQLAETPDGVRYRVNLFQDRKGPGAVFRLIPSKVLVPQYDPVAVNNE